MPGKQGRLVGTVLLAVALVVLLIGGVYLLTLALQGQASGGTSITGALLGFFLLVVIAVLPLGGGGIYLMSQGPRRRRPNTRRSPRRRRSSIWSWPRAR